jgi:hypothetical protein
MSTITTDQIMAMQDAAMEILREKEKKMAEFAARGTR